MGVHRPGAASVPTTAQGARRAGPAAGRASKCGGLLAVPGAELTRIMHYEGTCRFRGTGKIDARTGKIIGKYNNIEVCRPFGLPDSGSGYILDELQIVVEAAPDGFYIMHTGIGAPTWADPGLWLATGRWRAPNSISAASRPSTCPYGRSVSGSKPGPRRVTIKQTEPPVPENVKPPPSRRFHVCPQIQLRFQTLSCHACSIHHTSTSVRVSLRSQPVISSNRETR
jgi:hypothetical protein